MGEINLGNWAIRCFTESYSLWKNSDEDSVLIEYESEKIATITLKTDGSLLTLSENAYFEINEEQHLFIVWSPNDGNIIIEDD